MRVVFLPSRRKVELPGSHRVSEILRQLQLLPGTVLVIRNDEMLTSEDVVGADETIEIRSVISGGCGASPSCHDSRVLLPRVFAQRTGNRLKGKP